MLHNTSNKSQNFYSGFIYTQSISSCFDAPMKDSCFAYELVSSLRAESATKSQLEMRRVYNVFEFCSVLLFSFLFLCGSGFAQAASPQKTIKFATEATYAPFVTLDAEGKVGGFETELAEALCKEADLTCEFHHRPFDSLFPSLQMKKIDVVYGCIGITEARKSQVLFSRSLYQTSVGFILDPTLNNLAELNGKVLGIQQGTPTFEKYLKSKHPNVTLKYYSSIQDALLDLKAKRIQGVFGDFPVLKTWVNNNKTNIQHHNGDSSNSGSYTLVKLTDEQASEFFQGNAFAMRKENADILEKLNTAYEKISKEGRLEKLKKQWMID